MMAGVRRARTVADTLSVSPGPGPALRFTCCGNRGPALAEIVIVIDVLQCNSSRDSSLGESEE